MTDSEDNTIQQNGAGTIAQQMAATEAMAAAKLGAALAEPRMVDNIPVAVVPKGWHVESLCDHLQRPPRMEVRRDLHTPQALIDYYANFGTPKTVAPMLIVNRADDLIGASLQIICDYGQQHAPAWGDHIATVRLRPTPEWQFWTDNNKRKFAQHDFAELLEDNLPDIAEPDGATMLEICRNIEGSKNGYYRSAYRTKDGTFTIAYSDETSATTRDAANQEIAIPDTFWIQVEPWQGCDLYKVECRLRLRLKDGRLSLWYELVRPHKVLEDAFAKITAEVAAATGLTPIAGQTV